jgi:hypothetical protein
MSATQREIKPKPRKPRPACPKCGSKNQTRIMYGLPNAEAEKAWVRGEIFLGGCCVDSDSPEWHCRDCGEEWGKVIAR